MATKIFCCYARGDAPFLDKLKAHLRPLQHEKLIEVWDDQSIQAGVERKAEITKRLDEASIILLLVSSDFLNSDYCYGVEMQRAMRRHESGEATVIPVILRPCLWQGTPFGKLQALPKNAQPVKRWEDEDDALLDVASSIRSIVAQFPVNSYPLKKWRSSDPFYYIFLLDQSHATSSFFGQRQTSNGKRICDDIAMTVNSYLNELIITNGAFERTSQTDISIIGYGGDTLHFPLARLSQEKDCVTLSELNMNPLMIEMRKQRDADDYGREYEVEVPFPIWVKPLAQGRALMCVALQAAQNLAERWVNDHPESYPPIIINLSCAPVGDGDPTKLLRQIRQVGTQYGQTLIYNIYLTNRAIPSVYFPSDEGELPLDPHIMTLFSMSSVIPKYYRRQFNAWGYGRRLSIGSRGFICNGPIALLKGILPALDSQVWFDWDKD